MDARIAAPARTAYTYRALLIYFDHNATHPLSPAARQAWLDATERFPGNASSPHRLGDRTDRALNEARERLGSWLKCQASEIVWTSGATEAANTVLAHLAETREGVLLVSSIEHPCVLASCRRYFPNRHRFIPVSREGVVDRKWISHQFLSGETIAALIVMAANNETGVLQPWQELAETARHNRVPFFCDAAQWIGRMPPEGLGACDFVTGCAHKSGGPPGVGFLKHTGTLLPLIVGGPQEEGRRAGTENVPGILGMIAGLADVVSRTPAAEERRNTFERELAAKIQGVQILGSHSPRLWNTSAVIMPEQRDCRQRWVVKLDKLGFAVSTGSACASGKEEISHVLRAMGYSNEEAARVLRFSAGWNTTSDDWTALLAAVIQAARELM